LSTSWNGNLRSPNYWRHTMRCLRMITVELLRNGWQHDQGDANFSHTMAIANIANIAIL
jgi:hypothetical protein